MKNEYPLQHRTLVNHFSSLLNPYSTKRKYCFTTIHETSPKKWSKLKKLKLTTQDFYGFGKKKKTLANNEHGTICHGEMVLYNPCPHMNIATDAEIREMTTYFLKYTSGGMNQDGYKYYIRSIYNIMIFKRESKPNTG